MSVGSNFLLFTIVYWIIGIAICLLVAKLVKRLQQVGKLEHFDFPVIMTGMIMAVITLYIASYYWKTSVMLSAWLTITAALITAGTLKVHITERQYKDDKKGLKKIAKRRSKIKTGSIVFVAVLSLLCYIFCVRGDDKFVYDLSIKYSSFEYEENEFAGVVDSIFAEAWATAEHDTVYINAFSDRCRMLYMASQAMAKDMVNISEDNLDPSFMLSYSRTSPRFVTRYVQLHNAVYSGAMSKEDALEAYADNLVYSLNMYYLTAVVMLIVGILIMQVIFDVVIAYRYRDIYDKLVLEMRQEKVKKKEAVPGEVKDMQEDATGGADKCTEVVKEEIREVEVMDDEECIIIRKE